MKFAICFAFALAAIVAPAVAVVPQEHSHEDILREMQALIPAGTPSIRNTGDLPDAVFGLLGKQAADNAAPGGDGDCLQQDLADTAISLADGDSKKIATALLYRALERNSNAVGAKSALCTKQPISEILQGLTQHQDSASEGATENNKEVELTLGEKLDSIGEDPLEALRTATFAPGDLNDATAKGNSCNDANDANGCINTLNRAVPIATAAELQGGGGAAPQTAAATANNNGANRAAATAQNTNGANRAAATAAGNDDAASLIADINDKLDQIEALL